MGWNTSVLILNDALDSIANDKEFGKNLAAAIKHAVSTSNINVCAGYQQAAIVLDSNHADTTVVMALGGNCATVLSKTCGEHHTEEAQLKLLKQLAEKHGFVLRAKPKKKTK